MSLLSFPRRHRSLLWYRSAQRALARRQQRQLQQQPHTKIYRTPIPSRILTAPTTTSAVVALAKQSRSTGSLAKNTVVHSANTAPDPTSSAVAVAAVAAATVSTSEDSTNATATLMSRQLPHPAETVMTLATAKEAITSGASLELSADRSDKPQPQESSWSAMLIALFAMIQPKWTKEKLKLDEIPFEEIPVTSVPSQVSEVLPSRGTALFWRYDMDSYAANCKNEDRSQYVLDSIVRPGRCTETPVFFCGCYDGHGGEEAVDYVQKKLYSNIRSHLTGNDEPVVHSIIMGFKDTEEEFKRRSQIKFEQGSWSSCSVGACAVMALVIEKKLYVASCGDCRAIMAYRESDGSLSVEQITFDHSANEEREQRRLRVLYPEDYDIVCEIGHNNFYVKGRLQPTRSIGDTYMKVKDVNRYPMPRGLRIRGSFRRPYISAVPDIFQVDLQDRKPEFVVLGSDGLFGELKNEEIVQLVDLFRDQGVQNVSQALRETVLERIADIYGTTADDLENVLPGKRRDFHDDITIDVLHFAPPRTATLAKAAFRRPYISAVPDIFQVDLQDRKPEFVVLGSDGLFGELKNEEIVQLVDLFRDQGVQNVSQALRETVLERIADIYGTTADDLENVLPGKRRDFHDDITIDVLHFAPPRTATLAKAA
ncbi:Protein phosphatase 2C [Phytophthora infestans]|nr:Protein phosphatase 2C [Phytophthora infestans]